MSGGWFHTEPPRLPPPRPTLPPRRTHTASQDKKAFRDFMGTLDRKFPAGQGGQGLRLLGSGHGGTKMAHYFLLAGASM